MLLIELDIYGYAYEALGNYHLEIYCLMWALHQYE